MSSNHRILVIDDDDKLFQIFSIVIRSLGYEPDHAINFDEAKEKIASAEKTGNPYSVATIDLNYIIQQGEHPVSIQGLALGRRILSYIKKEHPAIACIIVTGSEQITPEAALDLRDQYDLDYFVSKDRIGDGDLVDRAFTRAVERSQGKQRKAKVFISYKHDTSWGHARALANSLREHNFDVFLDYDSINQGRFNEIIDHQIRERQFFIPILTPTTFDSEWVLKEIGLANNLKKQIIPLMIDDFNFETTPPPSYIDELKYMQGVVVNGMNYEDAINRLVTQFLVVKA